MRSQHTFAIAGGGIGGLAAAIALAQLGHSVTVFERRDAIDEDGAGIQIGPNGSRALKHLGLLDRVITHAAEPQAIIVADAISGRQLTRMPLGGFTTSRDGAPYLTLARPDLYAVLTEAARSFPSISIANNLHVTAVADGPSRAILTTDGGQQHAVDAAIVADGLWSNLRANVVPAGRPVASGKAAFRAVIPRNASDSMDIFENIFVWLSPGAHVVHYPVRNGRALALVVVIDDPRLAAGWNVPANVERLSKTIAGLVPRLRDTLTRAHPLWRMWSLQSMPPLTRFAAGRLALLGDAAHPILPFLAQGAVMALEDAVILARCIRDNGDHVERALENYSNRRRPRTAAVAKASAKNGAIYHLRGPAAVARNTVLRAAPANLLLSRYDWLYGWQPEAQD